jgi:hypothetical protein
LPHRQVPAFEGVQGVDDGAAHGDIEVGLLPANSPAHVSGPVRVIGTDVYGLDADKGGLGCE